MTYQEQSTTIAVGQFFDYTGVPKLNQPVITNGTQDRLAFFHVGENSPLYHASWRMGGPYQEADEAIRAILAGQEPITVTAVKRSDPYLGDKHVVKKLVSGGLEVIISDRRQPSLTRR